MRTTLLLQITTEEICRLSNINIDTMVEIVEHGIIQPKGGDNLKHQPDSWLFDPELIGTAKKAIRLHRDLDIDWAGIALAIELLDELDTLRNENLVLKRCLDHLSND